jgi:hypothetical protein
MTVFGGNLPALVDASALGGFPPQRGGACFPGDKRSEIEAAPFRDPPQFAQHRFAVLFAALPDLNLHAG